MPRSANPVPQYFTAKNKILVGGLMFYFEAGTSDPKVTFADQAETIPNTHPVVLDSEGRLPNVFFTGTAKQVLKDSDNVQIWERDNVGDNDTPNFNDADLQFFSTTQNMIDTFSKTPTLNDIVETLGFDVEGDGGNGQWQFKGLTGQTPSQTPSQLGNALLNDPDGNQWSYIKKGQYVNAMALGVIADGSTDDLAACIACLATGITEFPLKIIALSDELIVPKGSGIIGGNPHWKRRTTYAYADGVNTVFKYIGAGGSNTTVIRASARPVGDLVFSLGDDLTDVILRDFHVDADGLADFAIYMYRVGNESNIGSLTAEKAVVANHCHVGIFAADFGVFGSYEAIGEGVSIGVDIFGAGTVEATCFEYKATFLTANNGTGNTYVKGTGTDLENSGGSFKVGRGSEVFIRSESNFGRACVLGQHLIGGGTAGPTDYVLSYLEGNADGAFIASQPSSNAMRLFNGFQHPGNGGSLASQDITIEAQDDSGTPVVDGGPANKNDWPVLERLFGNLSGVGIDINSNTDKYTIRDCDNTFTFSDKSPLVDDFIPTQNQIGASCYFSATASPTTFQITNGVLIRLDVGRYRITFVRQFETAGDHAPQISIVLGSDLANHVRFNTIGEGLVEIHTFDNTDTLADTGDRIGFHMTGILAY